MTNWRETLYLRASIEFSVLGVCNWVVREPNTP